MNHYCALLWLVGQDVLSESTHNYNYYGKPQLEKICEFLGLDKSQWDDGVRENE